MFAILNSLSHVCKDCRKEFKTRACRAYMTSNICALSRIVIQVYELTYNHHFTSIPMATALLQVHQYATLPPSKILTALLNLHPVSVNANGIALSQTDIITFAQLNQGISQINKAIEAFQKLVV